MKWTFEHPQIVPLRIQDEDTIHTEANNFRCGIAGCPCSDLPSFADTQRMLISFAEHPGTLSRIDAAMHRRKITSQLEEETPTNVLPRWHGEIPDTIEPAQTWRVEARERRKRITVWHRIKSIFRNKKG